MAAYLRAVSLTGPIFHTTNRVMGQVFSFNEKLVAVINLMFMFPKIGILKF